MSLRYSSGSCVACHEFLRDTRRVQKREYDRKNYKTRKVARKGYFEEYRRTHAKEIAARRKRYYQENKERLDRQKREWARKYSQRNPEERRERDRRKARRRREKNPILGVCRNRLYSAFHRRGIRKAGYASNYGIDWHEVVMHLGPKPSNDHVIDHIRPCASFDFTHKGQVQECFHPLNHRWLHQDLNSAKADKNERDFQEGLWNDRALLSLWEKDLGILYRDDGSPIPWLFREGWPGGKQEFLYAISEVPQRLR